TLFSLQATQWPTFRFSIFPSVTQPYQPLVHLLWKAPLLGTRIRHIDKNTPERIDPFPRLPLLLVAQGIAGASGDMQTRRLKRLANIRCTLFGQVHRAALVGTRAAFHGNVAYVP